jgi:hypothetical protein
MESVSHYLGEPIFYDFLTNAVFNKIGRGGGPGGERSHVNALVQSIVVLFINSPSGEGP